MSVLGEKLGAADQDHINNALGPIRRLAVAIVNWVRILTKAHGVLRTFGGFILVRSILKYTTGAHHLFATKAGIDRLMKLELPNQQSLWITASMEQEEGGRGEARVGTASIAHKIGIGAR